MPPRSLIPSPRSCFPIPSLLQVSSTPSPAPAPAPTPTALPLALPLPSAPTTADEPAAPEIGSEPKKAKSRCGCCKAKVGLTGFTCKCGGLFCSAHRQPEDHVCSFDHKTADRGKLSALNPAVIAAKVTKF